MNRVKKEVERLEKEEEDLKEKLKHEKETVKSKMAEIDVHKEWDRVSVVYVYLSRVHLENVIRGESSVNIRGGSFPSTVLIHEFYVCHTHMCLLLLLCNTALCRRKPRS